MKILTLLLSPDLPQPVHLDSQHSSVCTPHSFPEASSANSIPGLSTQLCMSPLFLSCILPKPCPFHSSAGVSLKVTYSQLRCNMQKCPLEELSETFKTPFSIDQIWTESHSPRSERPTEQSLIDSSDNHKTALPASKQL